MILNFLDRFSIKSHISSFIKIRPVGAELFHADGLMDMTKLIVAFRNFSNVPKNGTCCFSMKIMVTRTRHRIILHVHCPPCYLFLALALDAMRAHF